jgi:hypothetical protein
LSLQELSVRIDLLHLRERGLQVELLLNLLLELELQRRRKLGRLRVQQQNLRGLRGERGHRRHTGNRCDARRERGRRRLSLALAPRRAGTGGARGGTR